MKPHQILVGFRGSQTGTDSHEFKPGTIADLSDGLAAIAVAEGWARPHEPAQAVVHVPQVKEKSLAAPEEVPDAGEVEEKSLAAAPENKMLKAAPENKAKKSK